MRSRGETRMDTGCRLAGYLEQGISREFFWNSWLTGKLI
jgi:hypothetical protein